MKALRKLIISNGKLIEKKELINFKGGDWTGRCEVMCDWGYFNAPASAANCYTAELICEGMWAGCNCDCGCNN